MPTDTANWIKAQLIGDSSRTAKAKAETLLTISRIAFG
jgi:hypothetical protein